MAGFTAHICQAKKNLDVLKSLNSNEEFDNQWQITVAYYSALHFINGFLADKGNVHPNNHQLLKEYIEPNSNFSVTRFSDDLYTAFTHMEIISRKARYLCDNAGKSDDTHGFITTEKDFHRTIKYLDKIMDFMVDTYNMKIAIVEFDLAESKHTKGLKYFTLLVKT